MVMNITESHQLGVSCDTKDAEGSRGVSGGPAQGGDVGATMETQCPVEDPATGRPNAALLGGHMCRRPFRNRDAWQTTKDDRTLPRSVNSLR